MSSLSPCSINTNGIMSWRRQYLYPFSAAEVVPHLATMFESRGDFVAWLRELPDTPARSRSTVSTTWDYVWSLFDDYGSWPGCL